MLAGLSPRQFAEWRDFYQLEPWGFEPQDTWFARVAATIMRGWAAKDVTVKERDFLLRPPPEVATAAPSGAKPGSMGRLLRALGIKPKP